MIAIVWQPANEFNDTFTTTAAHRLHLYAALE